MRPTTTDPCITPVNLVHAFLYGALESFGIDHSMGLCVVQVKLPMTDIIFCRTLQLKNFKCHTHLPLRLFFNFTKACLFYEYKRQVIPVYFKSGMYFVALPGYMNCSVRKF